MTKEEIKKAWGERYEIYKDFIDENGWIENRHLGFSVFVLTEPFERSYRGNKNEKFDYGKMIFRPMALKNRNTMILNGIAKEKFLEWLFETYSYQDLSVLYPLHLSNALIIEFFDSVGIYIEIIRNEGYFEYVVMEEWDYGFETRQEATKQAIKKANDIYNERFK